MLWQLQMSIAHFRSDEPCHGLILIRHCATCLLQVLEVEHNEGKIKLRATDGAERCTVALNSQICAEWASNEDLRSGCLLRLKADGLSYNQLQGELVRWRCRGQPAIRALVSLCGCMSCHVPSVQLSLLCSCLYAARGQGLQLVPML